MDDLLSRFRALPLEMNAGATPHDLQVLEEILACTLPPDVILLYRDHDGLRAAGPLPLRFMSVAEVRKWYVMMQTYDEETGGFSWIGHGVRAFWTDDNSNYAGVYVTGPLAGRVCFLNHEESTDIAPAYRSVRSFLESCLAAAEDELDWYELAPDYPTLAPAPNPDLAAQDWAAAQLLDPLFEAASREEEERWEREHLAFCIMALTPFEHTPTLYRFVHDRDMWIQAEACGILGSRKDEQAISLLAEVAESGTHNGQLTAIAALGTIGTPACLAHLLHLVDVLPPGWEIHLAGALQGCGCEATHDRGQWRYRLPGSERWIPFRLEHET